MTSRASRTFSDNNNRDAFETIGMVLNTIGMVLITIGMVLKHNRDVLITIDWDYRLGLNNRD